MITEDYVSFETAKLLKERGFNKDTYTMSMYDENGEAKDVLLLKVGEEPVLRPTLQMTMKWLREVHSLYIDIVTSFSQDGICYTFSCFNTMDLIQGTKGTSYHEYQTYEEAAEEAVLYCLQNLI